jgi:hypothetical protein
MYFRHIIQEFSGGTLMEIFKLIIAVFYLIIMGTVLWLISYYVGSILNFSKIIKKIIKKINKYIFLISTFIIYTLLGLLPILKIKLSPPAVEMSRGVGLLYYFQNNFTHNWDLKLMISLVIAIVPAILLRKRNENELS